LNNLPQETKDTLSKINSFLNKAESRLKANDLNSPDGSIKNALEGAILSSQLAKKSNVSYEVQDKSTVKLDIPPWVKNNAKWWSADSITASEFLTSLEFLINQRILVIPNTIQNQSESIGSGVPAWVKNNASWWANDVIGDSDFVLAIQYLISQRIIQVDSSKVNVSTTIIEEESTDTSLRLEPKNITKPEYKKTADIVLSGIVPDFHRGFTVAITVISPDGSEEKRQIRIADETFKETISFTHESKVGKYDIVVMYDYKNIELGTISFHIVE